MIPDGLLNKTATRKRFTAGAKDRHGHETGDWDSADATFPVNLQVQSGREIFDGQRVVIAQFRAYALGSADVTPKDRLIIDGQTYNVILVNDVAGMGDLLHIDLEQQSPGAN